MSMSMTVGSVGKLNLNNPWARESRKGDTVLELAHLPFGEAVIEVRTGPGALTLLSTCNEYSM
jgi:hypothetical protein